MRQARPAGSSDEGGVREVEPARAAARSIPAATCAPTRFQLALGLRPRHGDLLPGRDLPATIPGRCGRRRLIALGLGLEFAAPALLSPRPLQYLRQPWRSSTSWCWPRCCCRRGAQSRLPAPAARPAPGRLPRTCWSTLERTCLRSHRNLRRCRAGVNLGVFVFIVSAIVYVQQADQPAHDDIWTPLRPVATLTTTGFGDITLEAQAACSRPWS